LLLPAVALVVLAVVLVTIAASAASRRMGGSSARMGPGLRLIALAVTLAVAGILLPAAWREGGLVVLVVPVAGAVAAVAADLLGRGQAITTTLAAALMLFWSLLTGLGPGFFFLIPAMFLVAAATASWYGRRPAEGPVAGAIAPVRRH
jgi:hypothetical protein